MDKLIPLPHQVEDSEALLEYQFSYLWADPGTGKTLTALEAIRKGNYDRIVIICPRIATQMWRQELKRHFGDDFYVHNIKSSAFKRTKYAWFLAGALIVTYDLMSNEWVRKAVRSYGQGQTNWNDKLWKGKPLWYGEGEKNHPNSVMVLDEAHYVKNKDAKRTKGILGGNVVGLDVGLQSTWSSVYMLTGTPIMRHADDLWKPLVVGRYDIMKHYGVETYDKFVNEFCRVEYKQYNPRMQKQRVIVGSKNLDKLERLLADCKVIRRRLADVVDNLPPLTERIVSVGYSSVERPTINDATLMRDLSDPNSSLSKLRRKLGIAKLKDIVAYADEYANKPTLIGYWHTEVADNMLDMLTEKGYSVGKIGGDTPQNKREEYIAQFNAGTLDFLLGQVRAMGVAANLQEMCSHVLIAEELLSPGELEQFIARVYRRGQKRHVQVDFMRSDHGLDEALVRVREGKQQTINQLVT